GIRDDLVTGVQTCALPISQRAEQEADELVEREPQLLGPGEDILPAHPAGERLVLELLPDARHLEIREAARRPHQRAGDQESREQIGRASCREREAIAQGPW